MMGELLKAGCRRGCCLSFCGLGTLKVAAQTRPNGTEHAFSQIHRLIYAFETAAAIPESSAIDGTKGPLERPV